MDAVATKLASFRYRYGDADPVALAAIQQRIAEVGRLRKMITYFNFVRNIGFQLPKINEGKPYFIQTHEWTGLDRAIIGDFLACASSKSYSRYGFMYNALVVDKTEYKPSDNWLSWLKSLDILPDLDEETKMAYWVEQVNKAHEHYAGRRRTK